MSEIKPCPWCSGNAAEMRNNHLAPWIECVECGARGPKKTLGTWSIQAWNSLPRQSDPPASVREVLDLLPANEEINQTAMSLGSFLEVGEKIRKARALLERLEAGGSERVKELEAELAEARNTPDHLEHVQKIARAAQELDGAIEVLSVSSALERVGYHFLEIKVSAIARAADQILGKRKAGDPDA